MPDFRHLSVHPDVGSNDEAGGASPPEMPNPRQALLDRVPPKDQVFPLIPTICFLLALPTELFHMIVHFACYADFATATALRCTHGGFQRIAEQYVFWRVSAFMTFRPKYYFTPGGAAAQTPEHEQDGARSPPGYPIHSLEDVMKWFRKHAHRRFAACVRTFTLQDDWLDPAHPDAVCKALSCLDLFPNLEVLRLRNVDLVDVPPTLKAKPRLRKLFLDRGSFACCGLADLLGFTAAPLTYLSLTKCVVPNNVPNQFVDHPEFPPLPTVRRLFMSLGAHETDRHVRPYFWMANLESAEVENLRTLDFTVDETLGCCFNFTLTNTRQLTLCTSKLHLQLLS